MYIPIIISNNQLDRGVRYYSGRDLRQPLFALFRVKL